MFLPSRRRRIFLRLMGVSLALAASIPIAGELVTSAQTPALGPRSPFTSLQLAECLESGQARTAFHAGTGVVRFVGTEAGQAIPNPRPQPGASPETAARAYLSACGSLFGIADAADELTLMRSTAIGARRNVVRLQQRVQGVPVLGGELIVHLDGGNNILAVAGETLPAPALSTVPALDGSAAADTALDLVATSYGIDRQDLRATTPELWVFSPSLLGGPMGRTALVWRMDVSHDAAPPIRELVLVDAQQGSVALHFNQIETARNRNTYTANNTWDQLPGILVCNEGNPACFGGDADAIAAHVYAGDTYNFYASHFGRDSLNDFGLTLTSSVHYGDAGYRNAFWDSSRLQMAYGDGFSQADDVVGHELTHGVTQFTSNLFYYYQSGAINESLSDVFGELIDLTNGSANDTPANRWLLGEDIPGVGTIRNMANPPAYADPDKMTSGLYYTGAGDNGGVHFNSGLNNKAAYLMVDGGTFNGQTVTGLGIPKVAHIYYEAETNLLTSGSDYADLYDALYQACTNLIGTVGIVAADCQQVRNASIAVEMHLEPAPGFNPKAPLCGPGQTPLNIFFDSLEAGVGNFSATASAGSTRWYLFTDYAKTGRNSLYGDDFAAGPGDSSIELTNGVAIPAGAYLHFSHAFGFQTPDRDGGVIEYSADGGAWTDAGSLIDANGYRGLINGSFQNPLGGRAGFIGTSHGFGSTRLNLASLAGKSVRFRWRLGVDTNIFDFGWVVDDVRIYRCTGAVISSVDPNAGAQGRSNLTVTVTGQETHFVQGVTTASFGGGVTINSVTVTDATHASVDLSIAPNATVGGRDVALTTGGELAVGLNLFSITQGPQLPLIVPNRGQPGQQNLTVAITGSLTHFVQGQTIADFGAGITTVNTTVADATHAAALITIAGDAPLGPRNVTMTTDSELATAVGGFVVRPLHLDTTPFAYVVGRRASPDQSPGSTGVQTLNKIHTVTNQIFSTVDVGHGSLSVGSDGVAVSPDGTRAYVTNEMDNTVSVVDTVANALIATVQVGTGPTAVATHPDGTRVYVVNGSGITSVTVLDATSHATLATIPLGVPLARGVTISPDASRLYITTNGSGSVKVISTITNTVIATISVGNRAAGLDTSPDGARLYVATDRLLGSPNPPWVSVVDTATNALLGNTALPAQFANDVAVAPDGTRAYALTSGGAQIVDLATNAIIGNISSASGYSVEFTPDGSRAYVATGGAVAVVNAMANNIFTTVPFGEANGAAGSVAIGPGPLRTLSVGGSLSFGYRVVETTSQGSLVISNAGNAAMTIVGISYPAGFSGNWTGGTIPAGGSQVVTVSFRPTAVASYGGPITIIGDQNGGANTIAVSGGGIEMPRAAADFDNDGKADIGIFRRTTGLWAILQSGGDTKSAGWGNPAVQDMPVAADYDGDGKADLAVYRRTTGEWFIFESALSKVRAANWGAPLLNDQPVPADYDGDGKADLAVYRQSTGQWFVLRSSNGSLLAPTWGAPSLHDVPVPADYDGDHKADIAIYRLTTGEWFINRSSNASLMQVGWGGPSLGDLAVPGDYDGDGKADIAVYRLSTGAWYVIRSSNGTLLSGTWGAPSLGDIPVPGDYDGDGKLDFAVFRTTTAGWFIQRSSNGTLLQHTWGAPVLGDGPPQYR